MDAHGPRHVFLSRSESGTIRWCASADNTPPLVCQKGAWGHGTTKCSDSGSSPRNQYRKHFECYSNRNCDRPAHMRYYSLTEPWHIRGHIVTVRMMVCAKTWCMKNSPDGRVRLPRNSQSRHLHVCHTVRLRQRTHGRRRPQRARLRVQGRALRRLAIRHDAAAATVAAPGPPLPPSPPLLSPPPPPPPSPTAATAPSPSPPPAVPLAIPTALRRRRRRHGRHAGTAALGGAATAGAAGVLAGVACSALLTVSAGSLILACFAGSRRGALVP